MGEAGGVSYSSTARQQHLGNMTKMSAMPIYSNNKLSKFSSLEPKADDIELQPM